MQRQTTHFEANGRRFRSAFTLIELLVVLTIIGLVMAGIGVAFRDSGGGASLAGGQRVVASMLTAARGQAILHQTNARLLVALDDVSGSSNQRTLRFMVVVRQNDEGNWVPISEGVYLPRNIFFVPERNGDNETLFVNWNGSARYSNGERVEKVVEGIDAVGEWIVFEYNASGILSNAPPDREIILAQGRQRSPNQIVLDNQSSVRGIVLRRVGTYSLFDANL